MHGPDVTQQKHVWVADPHGQPVIRADKLLTASHHVKGDGGIDGGSGGSLDDVLCYERGERERVGEVRSTLFFPRKADSGCTVRGESSSSSSNSSTLGGHGTSLIDMMSSLSRSATLHISCSLLTLTEESAASTYVPPPHLS